jgi:hypothetical protein
VGDWGRSVDFVPKNMAGSSWGGESLNAKDMDELNDSSMSIGKSASTSVLVGEGAGDRDGDAVGEPKRSPGKASITGDEEKSSMSACVIQGLITSIQE